MGPYWNGPLVGHGADGMGGLTTGRIAVCKDCMFVAVNGAGSPFQGLTELGQIAAERIAHLESVTRSLRATVDELRAEAASPEGAARAGAIAAIEELKAQGRL